MAMTDIPLVMRQLSPREIRLTSPRILTPRMAAKVASASLDLPPVPSRSSRPAPSPLASQSTASKPELAPPLTWPAVPYAKLSDSPASPSSIQEYFPKQEPAAMLRETLERMRPELPAKPIASEWRPRRPVRPPSPRIEHTRTLSHSLSPDLVDHLRSPGESSPSSPAEEKDAKLRQPRRNNSISLKGLRHQRSGKNINTLWRRDEKDRPEVRQRKPSETVGLFTGGVEPVNSSFAGLRPDTMSTRAYSSSNGTGEFGTVVLSSPTTPVTPSLPNRPSQNGFASRMLHGSFSFSRKPSNAGQSKRSPSISSPVANTFHRIDSVPTGTHSSPGKSPGSPAPPKSVKRKPVPGLRGSSEAIVPSESLHSMRSFVLEDPPKKRVPMGVAL